MVMFAIFQVLLLKMNRSKKIEIFTASISVDRKFAYDDGDDDNATLPYHTLLKWHFLFTLCDA